MARKSTSIGGQSGKVARITPPSPTKDVPSPTGSAAKSGQYPGFRQNLGEVEANQDTDRLAPAVSVRGDDPALRDSYVHTAELRSSRTNQPGKEQVKDPNIPLDPGAGGTLGAAGGEYPGIPVRLNYDMLDEVPDPDENLAGATKNPQPREGNVGTIARHYPGVPQHIEGLAGAGANADPVRSILDNEGDNLNLRDIATGVIADNVGSRNVEQVPED